MVSSSSSHNDLVLPTEMTPDEEEELVLHHSFPRTTSHSRGRDRRGSLIAVLLVRIIFVVILFPLVFTFVKLSMTKFQTQDILGSDHPWFSSSPSSPSLVYPPCDLTGLRVLVVKVHFEGNLGDEMETTPLLHFLRHCNANVTAQLDPWLIWLDGKLRANSARNQALVDAMLMPDDVVNREHYDVVISAPGPDVDPAADIFFGVSLKDENLMAQTKLAVLREPLSYQKALARYGENGSNSTSSTNIDTSTQLYMSADLSFSFPVSHASLDFWERFYKSRGFAGQTLVFSRGNNFGSGLWISKDNQHDNDNKDKNHVTMGTAVHLNVLDTSKNRSANETTALTAKLPLSEVVFASSSAIEDWGHFQNLKQEYGAGQTINRFVICEQVEQLWALIKVAKAVYTDRYHPGVAARMFNKTMQVLLYKDEQGKLAGLKQLDSASVDDMRRMNRHAFQLLHDVLLQQYYKRH